MTHPSFNLCHRFVGSDGICALMNRKLEMVEMPLTRISLSLCLSLSLSLSIYLSLSLTHTHTLSGSLSLLLYFQPCPSG